ncbi:unnamed protein product [Haemonchus placei]|uniref:Sulfate_transp domain-containing protein n=1 Tax=Haemonchus placei TaxID=6290 RepID=A0A0N4WCZ8_HAEPC|nr:unnamed protein product [Haemonchus placei]
MYDVLPDQAEARKWVEEISIPAATLGLPLVILMLMVTRNSQANQGEGNIVLGVSGLHGCVAGITLIMCNEPYRKFVTRPLIECEFSEMPNLNFI